ncbi:MAG: hypothetical protein JXP34_04255, partial [Planctomycetes bacterium]|nr:hypothetical protein [Planctomycetota bacterium]
MDRREFMALCGGALFGAMNLGTRALGQGAAPGISWRRDEASRIFESVAVGARPLIDPKEGAGVMDGTCRLLGAGGRGPEVVLGSERAAARCGPVQAALSHVLLSSRGDSKEDLLEAALLLRNASDRPCEVLAGFLSGVRPCARIADQQVYVPLSAAGLRDAEGDARRRMKDCRQAIGADGFAAHYLEVPESDPDRKTTRAALLAPVVDIFADGGPCRVALFGASVEPIFFRALEGASGRAWRTGRRVSLAPGETRILKGYLLLHSGLDSDAFSNGFRPLCLMPRPGVQPQL